jgi:hypothetical protein
MTTKTELINAAYRVVTAPTVGAYRRGAARKGVPKHLMVDLIKLLLTEPISEQARAELDARVKALAKAEEDSRAFGAKVEAERAEHAKWVAARRHAYMPAYDEASLAPWQRKCRCVVDGMPCLGSPDHELHQEAS